MRKLGRIHGHQLWTGGQGWICAFSHFSTHAYRPTDQRTDGRTKPLIVACPRLKKINFTPALPGLTIEKNVRQQYYNGRSENSTIRNSRLEREKKQERHTHPFTYTHTHPHAPIHTYTPAHTCRGKLLRQTGLCGCRNTPFKLLSRWLSDSAKGCVRRSICAKVGNDF